DVDDLAAAAALHDRMSGLRTQKSAGQVGVEHGMPFGRGIGFGRLADRSPGVVDEYVDPVEAVGRLRYHRPAGALVRNIERDEGALAAERSQCRRGLLAVACRDDDTGARRRQSTRHTEADSAIAAGDDGNASG